MKSLSLTTPHLIIVIGIPGSGKSYFAQKFADMFHAPLIITENIAEMISPDSPLSDLSTAQSVSRMILEEMLKTKKTVVLDGDGAMRNERMDLSKLAKANGYQPLFVWLQIDTPTARQRCLKPPRGSEKLAMTSDEFDATFKRFSPPHHTEQYIVLSGKHTYASQARVLLRKLSAPRTLAPPTPAKRISTGNRISIS